MERISTAVAIRGFGLESVERLKVVSCRISLAVKLRRTFVNDECCEIMVELSPGYS